MADENTNTATEETIPQNTVQDIFKPELPEPSDPPVIEEENVETPEKVITEPSDDDKTVEKEAETTKIEDSEFYSQEEWDALPEDERDAILKSTEDAEATESPAVKEALDKINNERERILKEEADRDREYTKREVELNNKHRQRMSDLKGAARVAGVEEDIVAGADKRESGASYFRKAYKDRQFHDPTNPPIDPHTRKPMTAQQVQVENTRMNNQFRTIVDVIGTAIMDHPDIKAIAPIREEREARSQKKQDFEAWNATVVDVFGNDDNVLFSTNDKGEKVPSPEYMSILENIEKVGLMNGGASRTPEDRLRSVESLRKMNTGSTIGPGNKVIGTMRKPPQGTKGKRMRRPPPNTLAGTGRAASQAQGQVADNLNIMFSGTK